MMYNESEEPESEVRHVRMSWIQLTENRARVLDALPAGLGQDSLLSHSHSPEGATH
jgi:hypothetical protein